MVDWKSKYLKYKMKYLKLNQKGGMWSSDVSFQNASITQGVINLEDCVKKLHNMTEKNKRLEEVLKEQSKEISEIDEVVKQQELKFNLLLEWHQEIIEAVRTGNVAEFNRLIESNPYEDIDEDFVDADDSE